MSIASALARAVLRLAPVRAASARAGARGLAVAALPPLVFYVKRACDAAFAGVEVPSSSDVSALVKATVSELRLDASPAAVTLALATGGPPLDATLTLAEALTMGALAPRAKLLVTVHAPAAEVEEIIRYRFEADDVEMEQPVVSAADFDAFRSDKAIWAVQRTEAGVDQKLRQMTRLQDALKILATPGLHLLVRVKGESLFADVSNLKRKRKNAATSFEELANKAVTSDVGLRARYGELTPLNGGEGVVFVDKATCKDFASYDGLFLASSALVFNESKARLTEADIAVARAAHANLSAVVADPSRFTSRPADVIKILGLLTERRPVIVPLLSSMTCDASTAAACAAAAVHVLVCTGEGFACTLAELDFVA